MRLEFVNSLWIGEELSLVERMSIASFVAAGHRFRLFVYDHVDGIPDGVDVCDASSILPLSEMVVYKQDADRGSPALFACLWRFTLLHDHGGLWADTDQYCLKPFSFATDYVFSSENHHEWPNGHPNVGVIRVPPKSKVMADCIDFVRRQSEQVAWGVGPRAVAEAIVSNDLLQYVRAPLVFCPIPWQEAEVFFQSPAVLVPEEAHGVHLWGQQFRRNKWSLDEVQLTSDCLVAQLRDRVEHLL